MGARIIAVLTTAAACAALLAAPAEADFQTFYDDYRADGVIDGCSHSPGVLSSALNEIPADVREYDPGFAEAVNTALEQSASGCDLSPEGAAADRPQVLAADGSPGPIAPDQPAIPGEVSDRDLPAILVALLAVLAAALATAALIVLARRRGMDPGGWLRSRRSGRGF